MLSKTFEDSLLAGIKDINEREIASFHMPGHKKRIAFFGQERGRTCSAFEIDLTEIEGLDDLTYPAGAILNIEKKFAHVYRVSKSFLSLGGASHGLIAAILAVSKPGKSILIPRNAHRSIINAIVLSGAEVRWYEPEWETEWGFWGVAKASTIEDCLKNFDDIEAVVVVSPTFAGAVSDIASISPVLKEKKVKLIVDEAHGAHFVPGSTMPQSAALVPIWSCIPCTKLCQASPRPGLSM